MLIGYARVSTEDQRLDLQLAALTAAGVDPTRIYTDKASGLRANRPGLADALRTLREGDTLVVWRLDRLARSTAELLAIGDRLVKEGIALRSLTESLDTSNATGKLVFTVIAAMAEFERNLIAERTRAGLAAAKDRGRRGGRPRKLNDRQLAMAEAALADLSNTGAEVAAQFGVHRVTLLRQLKAYRERQATKKQEKRNFHHGKDEPDRR